MQAAGPVHEGLLALDTTKTERLVEADGVDLAPERREVARVFLPQRIHTRAHDAAPDAPVAVVPQHADAPDLAAALFSGDDDTRRADRPRHERDVPGREVFMQGDDVDRRR